MSHLEALQRQLDVIQGRKEELEADNRQLRDGNPGMADLETELQDSRDEVERLEEQLREVPSN